MKTTLSFKLRAFLCVFLFGFSSVVNSMILTFEGIYYSKSVVTGLAIIAPDPSFSPTTFQFQVDFDTSITDLFSQSSTGTYNNPDGTATHHSSLFNNTIFGLPVFSSSPFSSELGSSISQYTDPHLYNWSGSFLNDIYDSSGGNSESSGHRGIGFSSHFEFQPDNDYFFYGMEVSLYLANPPRDLGEVRFASSQELISELQLARDQGTRWSMNEVGFFHQNSPDRYGGIYSGFANLIAIDGVGITTDVPAAISLPEPGTFALFMTGLGLMGFMGRRRKTMHRMQHSKNLIGLYLYIER